MAWVDVAVVSGPHSLTGKSGQVPIKVVSQEDFMLEATIGQTHTYHYVGYDDFRLIFGEFDGIESIKKAHIEIHLLNPFDYTNPFTVSGTMLEFKQGSSRTEVSFPKGKNSGTSVEVDVAGVMIVRLRIGEGEMRYCPDCGKQMIYDDLVGVVKGHWCERCRDSTGVAKFH